MKYEHLLGILVAGMIIGLAYSTKSGNSKVERVEDERTEPISTKSARNGYAVMSFFPFAEYLWEYSRGNIGVVTKLIIPLAFGAAVLLISHYHYERVM